MRDKTGFNPITVGKERQICNLNVTEEQGLWKLQHGSLCTSQIKGLSVLNWISFDKGDRQINERIKN